MSWKWTCAGGLLVPGAMTEAVRDHVPATLTPPLVLQVKAPRHSLRGTS